MVGVLLFFFFLIGISYSSELYPIVEKDAYEEFLERKNLVFEKHQKAKETIKKQILNMTGEDTIPAVKSYKYEIDPTFVLDVDIPRVDKNGNIVGILYPKGYRFNPLDYMRTPPEPMIIFNPCIEKERKYVKAILKKLSDAILVSSGCPVKKIKNEYGRRIFLLTADIKEKFNIQYTVSIIKANMKKKVMEVEVVKVN